MKTTNQTLTSCQIEAYDWIDRNWHVGLQLAGSDNNYVAYNAFMAGVSLAGAPDLVSALSRIFSVSSAGLDSGGNVHVALNIVKSEARHALARAKGVQS